MREAGPVTTTTKFPIQLHTIQVTFLLDDVDTNGRATTFETKVPSASSVPLAHSHDGFDETVYGLEGVLTFRVEGQIHEISPGDALFIERGQVHSFDNLGTVDGAFLSVATPGIFRRAYFVEIAEVLNASAGGPPDRAAIVAVMHRHGLTPAFPQTASPSA